MLYAVWSTYRPHVGTARKTLLLRITANVNMWAFISIDYKALMQMVLAAGHILPEVSSDFFFYHVLSYLWILHNLWEKLTLVLQFTPCMVFSVTYYIVGVTHVL